MTYLLKKKYVLLLCLILLILPILAGMSLISRPVFAEAGKKGVVISLDRIVEYIKEKNLDVNIAKYHIDQAKSYYRQSFSGFLPSLSAQLPVENFNGGEIFYGPMPISLNRTTYTPILQGSLDVQTGAKPLFDLRVYKNQVNRSNSDYDATFQQNLLNACIAYFTWLKDFASKDVAYQSIREMEAQLKLNEDKYNTGFGTKLDIMQTKTQLAEKKNLLLQAENDQENSKIDLASLLNLSLEETMTPDRNELVPIFLWDKSLTLPQYYDIAFKTRPDIKALTSLIAESKAQYRATFAELFPTITLGGYMRKIGPLNDLMDTNDRSISLNYDVLRNLGFGTFNNIKVAKSKIQEAILNKEKKLHEIEKSLAQAYYNAKLYNEQIPVTQEKMADAEEAYRIALARLKTGIGMNFEVVQAQSALTNARLEYQTAIMNNNISQMKLLYECGQLTPEKILANKH